MIEVSLEEFINERRFGPFFIGQPIDEVKEILETRLGLEAEWNKGLGGTGVFILGEFEIFGEELNGIYRTYMFQVTPRDDNDGPVRIGELALGMNGLRGGQTVEEAMSILRPLGFDEPFMMPWGAPRCTFGDHVIFEFHQTPTWDPDDPGSDPHAPDFISVGNLVVQ